MKKIIPILIMLIMACTAFSIESPTLKNKSCGSSTFSNNIWSTQSFTLTPKTLTASITDTFYVNSADYFQFSGAEDIVVQMWNDARPSSSDSGCVAVTIEAAGDSLDWAYPDTVYSMLTAQVTKKTIVTEFKSGKSITFAIGDFVRAAVMRGIKRYRFIVTPMASTHFAATDSVSIRKRVTLRNRQN